MVALRRRWAQRTIFPLITLLKVGTEGDRERERERGLLIMAMISEEEKLSA